MEENFIKIYHWLYPLSWLYGIGVCLRNKLFDWGWLRSKSFDVPVICVGNLAVGGTGKTPHTEYLIKLLQKNGVNVATLSRGYKRKAARQYLVAKLTDMITNGTPDFALLEEYTGIEPIDHAELTKD